jgi:hypothetical protein
MKFTITGFLGAIKQLQSKLLPDGVGVDSRNQNPVRGDLRAWRNPLQVATVPAGRKTIYRMGRDVVSDTQYWLSWTTIVHAVRGFIASDTSERTYFTGSGTPKVTDNLIGLSSAPYPSAARELGVPKPSTAATLSIASAGSGTAAERWYVQTFVTDRGEESAPSPTATITCNPDAVIDLTGLPAVPAGNYGITLRRIYRTQTLTSGGAEFVFVKEIASGLTSTQDTGTLNTAAVLVTNGPDGMVGRDWQQPPADLKHLTVGRNGMMAGISGRSVRVCEPFKPYAWPPAYELLTGDVTPVTLASVGNAFVVPTTGTPYLITGSTPESLNIDPLDEIPQACVSERSVAVVAEGAVWAGPDGLAYYGKHGQKLLTAGILAREDWLAMKPETIVGCQYEGAYMAFYEPTPGTLKGFLIDPVNPQGLYYLDTGYVGAFFDKLRDALYVLEADGDIKKWDADATFMTATFISKVFRAAAPMNPSHMKVIADQFPVTVLLYSDQVDRVTGVSTMVLRETRTITSTEPVTLKGGYLSSDFQVEVSVTGVGGVQGVAVADNLRELAA